MESNEFKKIIEENTIIILDTNILLALVKYSTYSSSNIIKILNACLEKTWIPNQVFKEYNSNKNSEFAKVKKKYERFQKGMTTILKETSQKLHKTIKEAQKLEYPGCNFLEEELLKQIASLKATIDDYYKSLGVEYEFTKKEKQVLDLESYMSKMVTNDRIGKPITQSEMLNIIQEGELRYKYNIPPGYEDIKEKEGIDVFGDLFIWKELLNYTKENRISNVIFVTNDLKEDWWLLKGEEKLPVKIRPELEKEFKEFNEDCEIFFFDLSKFQSLSADYFKFPSYHTYLELNADTYCRNVLFPKYVNNIWENLYDYASQLDAIDFSEEFYKCNDNEVLVYELELISCEFQINNDFAIYSMLVYLPVHISLSYEDNEGDSFPMGEINLTVEANIEISQKIDTEKNKLDENSDYEITYIDHLEVEIVDPYDYYGDNDIMISESEATAEMYEALEEYHKH